METAPELGEAIIVNSNHTAEVAPILSSYVERLPGSFLEEKEFSIAWHYRNAEHELGSQRAKELQQKSVE